MTGIALGAAFLGGAAFGALAALTVAGLILVWASGTGGRPGWLLVGAIVGSALLGDWRVDPLAPADPVPWADATQGVAGRVVSIPTTDGRFQRFILDVDAVWDGATRTAADVRLDVTAPLAPEVQVGDSVWLLGAVTPLGDLRVSYADYLLTLGGDGSLFARRMELDAPGEDWRRPIAALRFRLDDLLARAAPGDTGALMAGLVTGDDHALTRERRDAFVRTGTSHLTAVSGSNVALLVTLASFGASGTTRRRWAWQVGVVGGIWLYALLALSGALMVAFEPAVLWRLSFQLSFAASLGLAAVVPGGALNGVWDWTKAAALTAVAAWVATLPFQVAEFGALSLAAFPANVLMSPLVAAAYPLAFLAAMVGLVAPPLGEAIAAVASIPAELMLRVADTFGGEDSQLLVPRAGPLATTLVAAVCGAILCLWSRDGRHWLARTVADARTAVWRPVAWVACAIGVGLVFAGVGLALT